MKLLLDEMWPAVIAEQLRQRGHDVVAVVERYDLRSLSDADMFAVAQSEERAIVTENVPDFLAVAAAAALDGRAHAGLVLTTNRRFPRNSPSTVGRMIAALDALLSSETDLRNREHWLR